MSLHDALPISHRRVVLEHRPERERLLVEDQRFAIGLDRERDLHRVLLAERAKRALPDDLRLILSLRGEIGRAHVRTPVTNAHIVCRLLLEKNKTHHTHTHKHIYSS